MKKKILIILFFVTFMSFIGIVEVKALPQCNIGICEIGSTDCDKGYGSVRYRTDNSVRNGSWIEVCKRDGMGKCHEGLFTGGDWETKTDKSRQILIEYNANIGNNHVLKSASFELYSDKDSSSPVCAVNLDVDGKTVASVSLDINHGKVWKIVVKGSYLDQDGNEIAFSDKNFELRKHLADGETDVVNDEGTTSEENPIESSGEGSSYGEHSFNEETGEQEFTTTNPEEDAPLVPNTGKFGGESQTIACDDDMRDFIRGIWNVVYIFVPIALIIFCTVDFLKAMANSDAEGIKKAFSNTLKRIIAGILLLALPLILKIILSWFGIELCM